MKSLDLECKKCGARWTPRKKNPVQCPRCKSVNWKGNGRSSK